MKNSSEKILQFCDQVKDKTGILIPHEQGLEVMETAFEIIKEGLVNKAINCTLDGDMNALTLEGALDEMDWEDVDQFKNSEVPSILTQQFDALPTISWEKNNEAPENWAIGIWDGSYFIGDFNYDTEQDLQNDLKLIRKHGFKIENDELQHQH